MTYLVNTSNLSEYHNSTFKIHISQQLYDDSTQYCIFTNLLFQLFMLKYDRSTKQVDKYTRVCTYNYCNGTLESNIPMSDQLESNE